MQRSRHLNPSVEFPSSWASVHFDLLRGLAALAVLLEHWRNLFFVDFPQLVQYRALLAIPYLICGAGHQAVVLFFVLSGYFVGGTVLRALERDRWTWRGYLLRRLTRLWMVLVPALLLCLFWDALGLHLGHAPALYTDHVLNHLGLNVHPRLAPSVFFGNLLFLQGVWTPVYGSDGALWSLANEFWYYLLFPLGLISVRRGIGWRARTLCFVLFLAVAGFVRGDILSEFPIWLMGALLYKLPSPVFSARTGGQLRVAAAALYLPLFFGVAKLRTMPSIARDYLLAVVTLALLWVLLSAKERFTTGGQVHLSRELARFSYTLYAVHLPALVFAVSLAAGDSRWLPNAASVPAALGVLAAAIVYAYGVAFVTEFRTDAVRVRLERLFGVAHTPTALPSNPLLD